MNFRSKPIQKRQTGFTLIEILVAIAILAVVVGLAGPNLMDWTNKNNERTTAKQFKDSLRDARTASKAGQVVVVCALNPNIADACVDNDATDSFEKGWQWFVDADDSGQFSASDTLLGQQIATDSSPTIVVDPAITGNLIRYVNGNANLGGQITKFKIAGRFEVNVLQTGHVAMAEKDY